MTSSERREARYQRRKAKRQAKRDGAIQGNQHLITESLVDLPVGDVGCVNGAHLATFAQGKMDTLFGFPRSVQNHSPPTGGTAPTRTLLAWRGMCLTRFMCIGATQI